jgi:putative ABC transport system permease protein
MNAYVLLRSLGGVFAHRLRAALTILGIVIGTGSIVLLASLITGGEGYLVETSQGITDDDVVKAAQKPPPPQQMGRTSRPLSRADATAIAASSEGGIVAGESSRETQIHYREEKKWVTLVSANPSTLALYRLRVASGRPLDDEDRTSGRRVCVVGHSLYEDLLRQAPLPESPSITVDGRLFSVVGVLANKPSTDGSSRWGWNQKVLIPETTFDTLYSPSHEVKQIYARQDGGAAAANATRARVTSILLERHLGVRNFELSKDPSGGMETLIFKVIHALLLSSGVLALLASGINIMNVMLVTVTERKSEIGLRRALGATQRSIRIQFLAEAGVLSLAGALIGVGAGIASSWLVALGARSAIGAWSWSVPGWSVALGIGLAVLTGLAFGILPAWRASQVSPIDALRAD